MCTAQCAQQQCLGTERLQMATPGTQLRTLLLHNHTSMQSTHLTHIWRIFTHSSPSSQGFCPAHRWTDWDKWQATAQSSSSKVIGGPRGLCPLHPTSSPVPEGGSQTITMGKAVREAGWIFLPYPHWERGQVGVGSQSQASPSASPGCLLPPVQP